MNNTAHRKRSKRVSVVTAIHSEPCSVVKGHPPPTSSAELTVQGRRLRTDLRTLQPGTSSAVIPSGKCLSRLQTRCAHVQRTHAHSDDSRSDLGQ